MCLLNVQLPSTSIPILKSSLESIKIRSIFYKSSCVVQTTHFEGFLCPDILNHNLIVPRSQREFKFAGQAQSILHEIPNAVFLKLGSLPTTRGVTDWAHSPILASDCLQIGTKQIQLEATSGYNPPPEAALVSHQWHLTRPGCSHFHYCYVYTDFLDSTVILAIANRQKSVVFENIA